MWFPIDSSPGEVMVFVIANVQRRGLHHISYLRFPTLDEEYLVGNPENSFSGKRPL